MDIPSVFTAANFDTPVPPSAASAPSARPFLPSGVTVGVPSGGRPPAPRGAWLDAPFSVAGRPAPAQPAP